MCSTQSSANKNLLSNSSNNEASPQAASSTTAIASDTQTSDNSPKIKIIKDSVQTSENISNSNNNNNNNNNNKSGKTSSTTCAKNKVAQSGFDKFTLDERDGIFAPPVNCSPTAVSTQLCASPSSQAGAQLTTGSGRLAAGSKLAPGNQAIFGGGGSGVSNSPVYSKTTGELIDNYDPTNTEIIISNQVVNKRKTSVKVSNYKRGPAKPQVTKRKAGTKFCNEAESNSPKTENIFLSSSTGGKKELSLLYMKLLIKYNENLNNGILVDITI